MGSKLKQPVGLENFVQNDVMYGEDLFISFYYHGVFIKVVVSFLLFLRS